MLQRQQLRPCSGLQHCQPLALAKVSAPLRVSRTAHSSAPRQRLAPVAATAAADAPAAAGKKPRKYTTRKKESEQENTQPDEPALPVPLDYQQTLIRSFTIAGIGLHSGEYAYVRVRPAFAGEGRYFVRVPEGANKERFAFDDGNNLRDGLSVAEAYDKQQQPEDDDDTEDLRLDWFEVYLKAQDERGYEGSFRMFMDLQLRLKEIDETTFKRVMGLTAADADWDELPAGVGVEPDMSMVEEDIVPLDPEDPSLVLANITSVKELDSDCPYTQLGEGDNRVMSVELLLAALEACGVDNARIEVEGGHEMPVLDNSALAWCIEVQIAGMRPAPPKFKDEVSEGDIPILRRDVISPNKAIAVQDESGWIAFFPGPFANITCGIDHTRVAPVIGCMWHTWHSDDEHFRYSLAPARGYAESIEQLYAMREAGYVQGAAENLFNIAMGDKWFDPQMLRMVYDEPVRHRLAQLIGNLSLLSVAGCQGIPIGHVTAHNAQPSLQLAFVRAMLESVDQEDVVPVGQMIQEQTEWLESRYGYHKPRDSTSQGPAEGLGDGSSAWDSMPGNVVEAEAEVMGEDEEDDS